MKKIVFTVMTALALCLSAFAGDVKIKVDGMKCKVSCPDKITKALSSVDGAEVKDVCLKSGTATIAVSDKASTADVMAAINKTGLKAVGQKVEFKVDGMTCVSCEKKLQNVFAKLDGVSTEKTCAKSGSVSVILSGKTDAAKVKESIIAAGYKVK